MRTGSSCSYEQDGSKIYRYHSWPVLVSFEDNIRGMEKVHTILDPQLALKLYSVVYTWYMYSVQYTPPPLPFTTPRINRGKQGNNRTRGGWRGRVVEAIDEQMSAYHFTYKTSKMCLLKGTVQRDGSGRN